MANFKIRDKLNLAAPADDAAFLIDIGIGYRHITQAQLRTVIQGVLEGRVTSAENAIAILDQNKSDITHTHALASATAAGFMSTSHYVKLENIVDFFKGYYTSATGLTTKYPTGSDGWYAYVGTTTKTIYVWDVTLATPAWVDTTLSSSGDMLASIYDPQGIAKDAFARANHTGTQAIATILGLQTALDGKAPTVHSHAIADVTGLQAALDGKATTTHSHTIAQVTGLQTALDGKSNVGHVHAIADVTGLQTALNGKANTSHLHIIADVVNLQTELNARVKTVNNIAPDANGNVNVSDGGVFNRGPLLFTTAPAIDYGNTPDYSTYTLTAAITFTIANPVLGPRELILDGAFVASFGAGIIVQGNDPGTGVRTVKLDCQDATAGSVRVVAEWENAGGGSGTADLSTVETFADIHSDFAAKGFVYSTSASLAASYTAGVVYAGGKRWPIAAGSSTVAASSDTYVDVSSTGAIVLTGVALGAAAPAIAAGSVRIAKLTSDTVAVTGVADLRNGNYELTLPNNGKFKVAGLHVKAPTNIGTDTALRVDSSTVDELLAVRNDGKIKAKSLEGTGTRFLTANATGETQAIETVDQLFITNETMINSLISEVNWNYDNFWVGGDLTATLQGQVYANSDYWYFMQTNTKPIRLARTFNLQKLIDTVFNQTATGIITYDLKGKQIGAFKITTTGDITIAFTLSTASAGGRYIFRIIRGATTHLVNFSADFANVPSIPSTTNLSLDCYFFDGKMIVQSVQSW